MGAVWFRAGHELRARWRGTIALVLLIGVSGAVGLASLSGARRTDTAYRRMLRFSRAADAEVGFDADFGDETPDRRIAAVPNVIDSGSPVYQFVTFPDLPRDGFGIVAFAAADGRLWRTLDRPLILRGRLPRPSSATEVAISSSMAARNRLHPGSRLRVRAATLEDALAVFNGQEFKTSGPLVQVTVTGVVRLADELASPPEDQASEVIYLDTGENVLFTPAFLRRYSARELATNRTAASR